MPIITIEGAYMTPEEKLELIRTMPSVASKIMNVPIEEFRTFIREYDPKSIGVGDVPLEEIFKAREKG